MFGRENDTIRVRRNEEDELCMPGWEMDERWMRRRSKGGGGMEEDGWKRMDGRGWIEEDGWRRMDRGGWIEEDG